MAGSEQHRIDNEAVMDIQHAMHRLESIAVWHNDAEQFWYDVGEYDKMWLHARCADLFHAMVQQLQWMLTHAPA
jgi:hypothetical protein